MLENQSTKNEYELKREQKLSGQRHHKKNKDIKRVFKTGVVIALVGGSIGLLVWYIASRPPIPESDIISKNSLHWHPELAIYVKGEKQEIPTGIGLGAVHQPIHTHDSTGVIHLEFPGLVRKNDITLGQFFKNWGKDMRSFDTNMKVTVNGKENTEYENYLMQDQDKIEIRYE